MSLKSYVADTFFRSGPVADTTADSEAILEFLQRFRAHYVSVDLVRIGGEADGGYLIPDILDEISYCFSPGVSDVADFETQIAHSHGIKSFLADASVDSAPIQDPLFSFSKTYLGNRDDNETMTLSHWLENSVPAETANLLLQMDIEESEYDVLIVESGQTLNRFVCMAIEFHAVHKIFDANFFRMFSSVFEKLFQNFSICHVHPNNSSGIVSRDGISAPCVFEVTFLRNDYVASMKQPTPITVPHLLDKRNVIDKNDIALPECWWRA